MPSSRVLMKGNEAIGEGAVRAGCRFYCGYPITPQNELFEYMAQRLPQVGGVFLQAESEVAAINYIYGAACAGFRCMISSSGPGVSLMQEGLSTIAAAQMPCLVVNVSRGGPGAGRIVPAQSDYLQATRGGGHGDYHLLVLAPDSVQEMADLTYLAFDLADHYRNPVMILADAMLGQMAEAMDLGHLEFKEPAPKDWALTGAKGRPRRVVLNAPLTDEGLFRLNLTLKDKYNKISEEQMRWEEIYLDGADIVVVAFGTIARLALAAVQQARDEGIRVGMIRPVSVWPFPWQPFRAAAETASAFLTIEMNSGQMIEDVRLSVGDRVPIHHLPAYMYGQPAGKEFSPQTIFERIINLARKEP